MPIETEPSAASEAPIGIGDAVGCICHAEQMTVGGEYVVWLGLGVLVEPAVPSPAAVGELSRRARESNTAVPAIKLDADGAIVYVTEVHYGHATVVIERVERATHVTVSSLEGYREQQRKRLTEAASQARLETAISMFARRVLMRACVDAADLLNKPTHYSRARRAVCSKVLANPERGTLHILHAAGLAKFGAGGEVTFTRAALSEIERVDRRLFAGEEAYGEGVVETRALEEAGRGPLLGCGECSWEGVLPESSGDGTASRGCPDCGCTDLALMRPEA